VPKRTLTAASVERIKPPKEGQVDVFDAGYPGLALRVSYGGRKSWVFFYRIGQRLRRMSLGTYPALGLAQAHDAWREARKVAQSGQDPSLVRKHEIGSRDFATVLDEWLKRDQSQNRSKDSTKRLIDRNVMPLWQHRFVSEIKRPDIMHALDEVVDRGSPIAARRLHAHLHRFFKWCVEQGYIEISPMMHLTKPGVETKRDRVLSDEELKALWSETEKLGWPFGTALQLLILTGARRQEIAGLQRSELKGDIIELSVARTKNGKPHIIPLSPPALAILSKVPRVQGSEFIFTTNGRGPVVAWASIKAKLDNELQFPDWRLHDLRRTVATGLQKLGTPLQVTEAILGHTSGSRGGIVDVYQRYDYGAEKRAALEAWGAHIMALVQS